MTRRSIRVLPWLGAGALAGLAGLVFPGLAQRLDRPTGLVRRLTGGEVHGYVIAGLDLPDQGVARRIYLPDVSVFARRVKGGAKSPVVKTDRKGFFVIPSQPPGSYEICLAAPGFRSVCPKKIQIGNEIAWTSTLTLPVERIPVLGTVRFKDGSACGYSDQVFDVRFDTWVVLKDGVGNAVSPRVRTNLGGEFVIGKAKPGRFAIEAVCEGAKVQQPLAVNGPLPAVALALPNQRPRSVKVIAFAGGKAVRETSPGATVEVKAESRDDDTVSYRWDVSGGTLSSASGESVKWTLPPKPGVYSIYALALDRRGGATFSRRDLLALGRVYLSGAAVDRFSAAPIAGAEVEINSVFTKTAAGGTFLVELPEETSRYVVTIRKPGYQLYSQVLNAPLMGKTYRLVPVEETTLIAEQGGRLGEKETCRRRATLAERDRKARPLGSSPCGAEVVLPPGSLVDRSGKRAQGAVRAWISTIDLREPDGGFPGEYAGLNDRAQEVGLNSLGAIDVQLADASGSPLNLAPGHQALVRIPVDSLQLGMPGMPPAPPPTIPLWFYDPKRGVWVQEGTATLAGNFYEGKVRHFSTINADFEFTNPACMRVVTDTATLSLPYQLRLSIPAVAPVKIKTEPIADPLSVIVRLPPSTQIKLEVLDSQGHPIQTATVTPTTGPTSSPAFPTYAEYGTCTSEVEMGLDVPADGGQLLAYYTNGAADADAYYAKIDPTAAPGVGTVSSAGTTVTGAATTFDTFFVPGHLIRAAGQVRLVSAVANATTLTTESAFPALPNGTPFERVGAKPTLNDWKAANGFVADDADAVYLNAGDLGLGRWMHLKKQGNDVAYYVSNYGIPPNLGSADLAALAKLNNDPGLGLIATVAMEYSPLPGDPPNSGYTKFYVYNNLGHRVNKAELDDNGNKYIPMLCVVCHGGNAFPPSGDSKGDLAARFIPFDPPSFRYSGLGAQFQQPAQEPAFKLLNSHIRDFTNETPAVQELIEGWYGGPGLPLGSHQSNFVPNGWIAPIDKSSLYTQVVRESCRTCHTTRQGYVAWNIFTPVGFKEEGFSIKSFVCGPGRIMPNAKVTYRNFWLSTAPHRPAALGNGGLDNWAPADPCPN